MFFCKHAPQLSVVLWWASQFEGVGLVQQAPEADSDADNRMLSNHMCSTQEYTLAKGLRSEKTLLNRSSTVDPVGKFEPDIREQIEGI